MDVLNDFFSLRDVKREAGPSGYVSSRRIVKAEPNRPAKREHVGTDYGEEQRKSELEDMKKVWLQDLTCIESC